MNLTYTLECANKNTILIFGREALTPHLCGVVEEFKKNLNFPPPPFKL